MISIPKVGTKCRNMPRKKKKKKKSKTFQQIKNELILNRDFTLAGWGEGVGGVRGGGWGGIIHDHKVSILTTFVA